MLEVEVDEIKTEQKCNMENVTIEVEMLQSKIEKINFERQNEAVLEKLEIKKSILQCNTINMHIDHERIYSWLFVSKQMEGNKKVHLHEELKKMSFLKIHDLMKQINEALIRNIVKKILCSAHINFDVVLLNNNNQDAMVLDFKIYDNNNAGERTENIYEMLQESCKNITSYSNNHEEINKIYLGRSRHNNIFLELIKKPKTKQQSDR